MRGGGDAIATASCEGRAGGFGGEGAVGERRHGATAVGSMGSGAKQRAVCGASDTMAMMVACKSISITHLCTSADEGEFTAARRAASRSRAQLGGGGGHSRSDMGRMHCVQTRLA
jgi:hypothetical protein